MKKKLLLILSMVLVGLFAGLNTAWAINMSKLTREQAKTLAFWARLTAKQATTTTGSGKVFVSVDPNNDGTEDVVPEEGDYVTSHSGEGFSDIFLASSLINADANFSIYAKPDAGSYFTGWSFTDGYTDLGNTSYDFNVQVTPSPKAGIDNAKDYTIYAAFESIKLVSSTTTGTNIMTPENTSCTQTVTFRAECPGAWALSSGEDTRHFKLPAIERKEGTTGTWTTSITEWNTQNIRFQGDYAEVIIPVTFTAPDANPADYAATLTLETYAGVKMKVYLYARLSGGDYEAVRLNKAKVQQETGSLSALLANAAAGDIIKLNKDYASAVELDKNITFDLNGYTLSNTITVSSGTVTIPSSGFGGSANALNVTGGKAILNGGSFGSLSVADGATVEQKGAVINGAATSNGTLTTTDGMFNAGLTSTGTLTLNGGTFGNNSGVAVNITGGTATIKRGNINGYTYGVQTDGGSATIEKLAVVNGSTKALNGKKGSLTVNNGKFNAPDNLSDGTVTFNSGYFMTVADVHSPVLGKQVWRNTAGTEFREGYGYFAGDQAAAQASNVSVCRIGKAIYPSLESALSYANNHLTEEVIIIMENDYTLGAGYYTLPANATLIVPMSNEQEVANAVVPRSSDAIATPNEFRTLTFESGVNMTVQGTIELSCTQYGKNEEMGIPGGNYGHLVMKPGSHMVINSGGELRAWGFVTGDGSPDAEGNYLSGEIDARRGAVVREMFQMGDWKGGDISFTMAMEIPGMNPTWRDLTHLFPVYTYFIQNVESPVKYHPGSSLICATSVNVAGSINAYANDIKVVGKDGEAAMFLMDEMADAENTWVRKWYDAKNDKQVYDVNSGAKLGSVVIDLGEVPGTMFGGSGTMKLMLDSRSFVLPLTSNFKIHLLTGYMEFTQSTSCLPGMEVEVDKEAEVALVNDHKPGVAQGALYLYDAEQWTMDGSRGYVGNKGRFGAIVRYSATLKGKPTVRDISSPAAIGDAKLIVHGTFRSGEDCSVYTSWSKDLSTMGLAENGTGGASIISTNEDAGTFIFDADAPAYDGVKMDGSGNLTGIGTSVLVNYDHNDYGNSQYPIQIKTVLNSTARVYGFELCTPAKLKNADGSLTATEGTLAGTSFCYMNDQWSTMQVAEDQCFMKEVKGGVTTYYAKPAEYVAVNATWDGSKMVGNADHTYSDKAGTGRLFILVDDCQWWEVEKEDNLYHCKHKNNDTYYYWDETEGKWMEKRFTITWLNDDGTEIKSYTYDPNTGDPEEVQYSVPYGTQAEYLGQTPTLEPDEDYTYVFTGWAPALGKVTSNVTYTATYNAQPREYTIIFLNEGGDEIERHLLTHNAWPVCENVPTKAGNTLQWEPEIVNVTGDATYRATWLEEEPEKYAITFYDYDGKTKLYPTDETPYMVAVGETPVYGGTTPAGKTATSKYTYVFDHWSPEIAEVTVDGPKSYTAIYNEVAKAYTISYYKEDGTTPLTSEELPYGATPTPPVVSKENPEPGHTYTLVWKTLNESANIASVTGDAAYKPTYLDEVNKFLITLKSTPSEAAASLAGAGLYKYGTSLDIKVLSYNSAVYKFDYWKDEEGNIVTKLPSFVTEDITLTAHFSVKPNDLEVGVNETEDLAGAPEERHDLVISSNGSESGQLKGAKNLTLTGEAIFRMEKNFAAQTWYAVAVPWTVDISSGIYDGAGNQLGVGAIYVIEFDATLYANSDREGGRTEYWKFLDETGKNMEPGKLYMIYLNAPQSVLEFHMKTGTQLWNTTTSIALAPGSVGGQANWNAIANPALYHANLNTGVEDALVYNGDDSYIISNTNNMIVGEPAFVQATTEKPVVEAEVVSVGGAMPAYRRTALADDNENRFVIELMKEGKLADRLVTQTTEEKPNEYVIGQDLAKMSVSQKVGQLWIDRYDAKLCKNTIALENGIAEYPLSLFVPVAGEYLLSGYREKGGAALYLTRNGEVIWNLSENDYLLSLDKGTSYEYGLRVNARTPQVTTGIEEALVDSKNATATKILINNQVFIIRGEKVYSIDGQLVR